MCTESLARYVTLEHLIHKKYLVENLYSQNDSWIKKVPRHNNMNIYTLNERDFHQETRNSKNGPGVLYVHTQQ